MKSFIQLLREMPVEYAGQIQYWPDSKFPLFNTTEPLSRYVVLGDDDQFVYLVNGELGYVFSKEELKHKPFRPVMRVSLRDSIKGLKQAHTLRIRESFSDNRIASTWYELYSKHFGGIVSDYEHLQGGKSLWMGLIKTGHVTSVMLPNEDETGVSEADIPNLWSKYPDQSKKNLVLIYRAS